MHISWALHWKRSDQTWKQQDKGYNQLPHPKDEERSQIILWADWLGYYWCFIKDYATKAKPLSNLTKKMLPEKEIWTPECQKAIGSLKSPYVWPCHEEPWFWERIHPSDWCVRIWSGSSIEYEGSDHAIAYFSRKLLPREMRYSPQWNWNVWQSSLQCRQAFSISIWPQVQSADEPQSIHLVEQGKEFECPVNSVEPLLAAVWFCGGAHKGNSKCQRRRTIQNEWRSPRGELGEGGEGCRSPQSPT